MASHRLVHAVVEHLGGEVMESPLVRSPDIHSRATTNRLEPLEDLDRMRVIILGLATGGNEQI
jgi:hypothetical protein